MVGALKNAGIYDETLIIVCAKHGQSPIDQTKRVGIGGGQPATLINTLGSGEAFDISDDGSLIWLNDSSRAGEIAKELSTETNQATLGIQEIFAGPALREKFNSPLNDTAHAGHHPEGEHRRHLYRRL